MQIRITPVSTFLAVCCGAAGLYYLAFFLVVRHEPSLFIPIAVFAAAIGVLFVPVPRLARWQTAAVTVASVVVAVAWFRYVDASSHSISDTLIRFLPPFSVLGALCLRALSAAKDRA